MAYQLSPGVTWSEIDLTTIVPAVSTTIGAYVGDFEWGPVGEVMILGDELELVRYFGEPTANTYKDFFTAANFLAYGQQLDLVRAANTAVAKNATNGSAAILIKNREDYRLNYENMQAANTAGMFAARYPGDKGNGIKVSVWAKNDATEYQNWEYYPYFNSVTGTSNYVSARGGANDEMHIIVVDTTGKISGVANTVLERYPYLSKASDAVNDDGSSNYYVNVLQDKSQYIYAVNHAQNTTTQVAETTSWGNTALNTTFSESNASYTGVLSLGVVGTPTDGDLIQGYDLFKNADEWDISFVMTGAHSQTVSEYVINNIAEHRKDCITFISPLFNDAVDNAGFEATDIVTFRNAFNSSSYTVVDSAWKLQFDKYNNVYRWVPMNGDIAGLCARTDFERDAWWSPAGFNRGHIKNVTRLSWNPGQADRDTLYVNGINPIVNFKGEGVVLYGDKTMQTKPSAFDRINVRRLFIVLEKAISKAARYSLFEFNDEFTRAQFVAMVEPYLRDVKGRRGIYDFKVVCDESNNTPEVIDRNEFIGDIYIKPARSINYIHLNFVAVRTGVAFSEVVGKF